MVFISKSGMGLAALGSCPRPSFRGGAGLNQQRLRIRSPERSRNSPGESPARRVRSVHRQRKEQMPASAAGTVLVAGPVLSTRLREDRHANARRPLVGSGSDVSAARVEPSPVGLAQVHTAARAEHWMSFYATAICTDGNTTVSSAQTRPRRLLR